CLTLLPLCDYHAHFFLMLPHPPTSTLFPYTTLFRSGYHSKKGVSKSFRLRERSFDGVPFDSVHLARKRRGKGTMSTPLRRATPADRKSTRLNSSHRTISYAVFCLKKKNTTTTPMSSY